jgi:2,3-bisphosphoglycerate-independent phosphoglycerate mutase
MAIQTPSLNRHASVKSRASLALLRYNCDVPLVRRLHLNRPKPLLLLILDGWGYREETADNAIALAQLPHWQRLLKDYPYTLVHTEGRFVGLPDGQMGNSEVGHMNIGAGRIVYQDLTRVDADIESGGFYENAELVKACDLANQQHSTLHVFGLLSPGGVHSHESHIFAMLDLAHRRGVEKVAVHAFLDGRDMPPKSAEASVRALQIVCNELGNAKIATVTGRYFAMDRDQRWDRQQTAYLAIAEAQAEFHYVDALSALVAAYDRGETDEFVKASVIDGGARMENNDAVVFMNFRADRARQLTSCFVQPDFSGFIKPRQIKLSRFVCLSQYDEKLDAAVAYGSDDLPNTLSDVLAAHHCTQLRIAETEKYAHVTFFFSGGREPMAAGEQRILIPSPKVATYDLQPEMSCPALTEKLVAAIRDQQFDVIVCNIANPDMVGHTGDLSAAIKAAEAVDIALGALRSAIVDVQGEMLVTADHGNLEMMRDPITGEPHTAHTIGPVPFVYVGRKARLRDSGALRDIAPTILYLLNIEKPVEMTGTSLVELS